MIDEKRRAVRATALAWVAEYKDEDLIRILSVAPVSPGSDRYLVVMSLEELHPAETERVSPLDDETADDSLHEPMIWHLEIESGKVWEAYTPEIEICLRDEDTLAEARKNKVNNGKGPTQNRAGT